MNASTNSFISNYEFNILLCTMDVEGLLLKTLEHYNTLSSTEAN